jgi:UDP-N-acetylglucosamine 4-epimerase
MRILVTGGAGFIGSNIVEGLLKDARVSHVRVLDNLTTGFANNLEEFDGNPKFDFIEGDIRDFSACVHACDGVDLVSHQAALGSVPRSINDPLTTNEVNITGTLNVFTAAKEKKVKRVVYAASSSTYGDHTDLPKVEHKIGKPLSPYAITKYVNELYAEVFGNLYEIEFIGLRYFNVFGQKQNPKGPYAAVIPLFMEAVLRNESPTINGNGEHSRDFTYVSNAVEANILALFTDNKQAVNQVYNIAYGHQTSLSELFNLIKKIAKSSVQPVHGPERVGDVKFSMADISKAKQLLKYDPKVSVEEGLMRTFHWYKESFHAKVKMGSN